MAPSACAVMMAVTCSNISTSAGTIASTARCRNSRSRIPTRNHRPPGNGGSALEGTPRARGSEGRILIARRRRLVAAAASALLVDLRFDGGHQLALFVVEARL